MVPLLHSISSLTQSFPPNLLLTSSFFPVLFPVVYAPDARWPTSSMPSRGPCSYASLHRTWLTFSIQDKEEKGGRRWGSHSVGNRPIQGAECDSWPTVLLQLKASLGPASPAGLRPRAGDRVVCCGHNNDQQHCSHTHTHREITPCIHEGWKCPWH